MSFSTLTPLTLDNELWKACPGFPSYEVSSLGRVRRVTAGCHVPAGGIIAGRRSSTDYLSAALFEGGKRHSIRVHRLIASAFIGAIPEGMTVNHTNGRKDDNRARNLGIVSHAHNCRLAYENGQVSLAGRRGTKQRLAKLNEDDVRAIRSRYANGEKQRDIGTAFGVVQATIWAICSGNGWKHVS